MSEAGKLGVGLALDGSSFLAGMVQAGTVTEQQAARMQRSLKYVTDQIRVMSATQRAANDSVAGIKQAGAHMEEFGFKTAGAKRELLVLGHELSQGNFKRFGGSLLVLGERTGAASLLFSSMGIAAIAAAGALAAFAAAAAKGFEQSDALAKSLQLTNNFAGMTADEFDRLARVTSQNTHSSIGTVRDVLQELVASGQFAPGVIAKTADAITRMEKFTGKSAQEIVKDFEKMAASPSKFAEELDRQQHFITASQMELIKGYEDTGKSEQAQVLILDLLSDHLHTNATWWDEVKRAAGGAWDAMVGNGRQRTVQDEIDAIDKRLANAKDWATGQYAGANRRDVLPGSASNAGADRELRRFALARQAQDAATAAAQAEEVRIQTAGKAARLAGDRLLVEAKDYKTLQNEIAKTKKQIEDAAKAGVPFTAAQQAAMLAQVQKQFAPKSNLDPKQFIELASAIQKYNDESMILAGTGKKVAAADAWAAEMRARLRDQTIKLTDVQRKAIDQAITGAAAYRKEGEEIEKAAEMEQEFQKWFGEFQRKEAGSSFGDAANTAISKYFRDGADQAKFAEHIVGGAMQRMEDSIMNFVRTGKLSFKDLFGFMADEFLRNQIRMMEKNYLTDASGSFSLGALGSAITGGWGALVGMFGGASLAVGTDYVPYDGMPAILHKGEAVVPAAYNHSARQNGGGAITVQLGDQHINVGQGVSMEQVAGALHASNVAVEQRIRRAVREGRLQ